MHHSTHFQRNEFNLCLQSIIDDLTLQSQSMKRTDSNWHLQGTIDQSCRGYWQAQLLSSPCPQIYDAARGIALQLQT